MPTARRAASRFARTMRSLGALVALGAGLAVYNAYSLRRDAALATGPRSEAQHAFFVGAADRPDIELFYKGLTPEQRLAMAERVAQYDDPQLAALIGTLLGSFDSRARGVLTSALVVVGKKHPEAVAAQLKQTGSLQLFALYDALRQVGASALPAVAAQLRVKDARPNASTVLVAAGPAAVPVLLPYLNDPDKDIRTAAADALGKIGARSAVPALVTKYTSATGDERFGYLSAIAAIGAPETEGLLTREVDDASLPTPRRAQAMLGLGRIGSPTAVAKLWSFAADDDTQVREAMISALQLAGNAALRAAKPSDIGLRVAGGIRTPEASAYIARMLADPSTLHAAAQVAGNRPELVPSLFAALHRTDDGDAIDADMRALATTRDGIARLKTLVSDPTLGGFATRRLKLLRI